MNRDQCRLSSHLSLSLFSLLPSLHLRFYPVAFIPLMCNVAAVSVSSYPLPFIISPMKLLALAYCAHDTAAVAAALSSSFPIPFLFLFLLLLLYRFA